MHACMHGMAWHGSPGDLQPAGSRSTGRTSSENSELLTGYPQTNTLCVMIKSACRLAELMPDSFVFPDGYLLDQGRGAQLNFFWRAKCEI